MNMLKVSLAAGVVALSASTATAASIMIDDFNTFQRVDDDPSTFPNTDTDNFGDVLGGSRALTVSTNPSNPPSTIGGSTLQSTGATGSPASALNFSNSAGQQGIATVVYGVDAGGAALGDLTDNGTNDKFFFDVLFGDLPGTFYSATVDDGTISATVQELLSPGFSPFQAFADFGGVDFENVQSLTFTLNSNGVENFDGAIGSISAVPLPASALLLLGGIGGLAGFGASKRRRRKS